MPTDPKKLAQLQKVELMRMRHRAVPADPKDKPGSVGVDQRLHVKARWRGDLNGIEKVLWFRKVTYFHLAPPDCPLISCLECGYWEGARYGRSSFQCPDHWGMSVDAIVLDCD